MASSYCYECEWEVKGKDPDAHSERLGRNPSQNAGRGQNTRQSNTRKIENQSQREYKLVETGKSEASSNETTKNLEITVRTR